MSVILRLYCAREGYNTQHKLVGLRFVCLSCEILAQTKTDHARIWERIANHDERHGKKGDKNAS